MSADYKIVDVDLVQGSTCVKPADSRAKQERDHRELVFQVKPTDSFAFLKLPDDDFGWYNIPLGNVTPQKEDQSSKHENVLIPVVPRIYTSIEPDEDFTEIPDSPGFIYVFKDGYFWRELGVTEHGNFRDVNLEKYQGEDWRPVSAGGDNRILVPYKVDGEECKIEMCYSRIQWSWAYINRMGGMNDKDFRLNKTNPAPLATDLGVSKSDSDKLRKTRLQELPLNTYPSGFSKKTPSDNIASIANTSNDSNTYHLRVHRKSQIPTVSLQDPVGVARRLHADLTKAIGELDAIVLDLRGLIDKKGAIIENPEAITNPKEAKAYRDQASKFYMAAFISNYMYTSVDDLVNGDRWKDLTDDQREQIEDRKSWRKHIHTGDFEEFLRLKDLKDKVECIQNKKAVLIYFLESELKYNKNKTNATFLDGMRDYFSCGKRGWIEGMETMNDMLHFLTQSPMGTAQRLFKDLDEIDFVEEEDMGEDFVMKMHGVHPVKKHELATYQFPVCKEGTEDDPFPYEENEPGAGLPEFNTKEFTKWVTDDQQADDLAMTQVGRRGWQAFEELIANRWLNLTGFSFKTKKRRQKAIKAKLGQRAGALNNRKASVQANVNKYEGELNNARNRLETATNNRQAIEAELDQLKQEQATETARNKAEIEKNNKTYQQKVVKINQRHRIALKEHNIAKAEFKKAANLLKEAREELVALKRRVQNLDELKAGTKYRFSDLDGDHLKSMAVIESMHINRRLKSAGLKLKNVMTSLQDVAEGKLPDGTMRINHSAVAETYKKEIAKLENLLDTNTRTLKVLNSDGIYVGRVRMDSAVHLNDSVHELMKLLDEENQKGGMWSAEQYTKGAVRKLLVLEEDNAEQERDQARSDEKQRHKQEASQNAQEQKSKRTEREKVINTQRDSNRAVDHYGDRVASETATRNKIKTKIDQYKGFITKSRLWDEKYANRLNYSFQGGLFLFEVVNLWQAWSARNKNPTSKTNIELVAAMIDLAATINSIQHTIFESKYGKFTDIQKKFIKARALGPKAVMPISRASYAAFSVVQKVYMPLNAAASFTTALISANEAFIASQVGDDGAAWGMGTIAAGATLMTAGAIFAGAAAAGAITGVGVVLILIGAIVYWALSKEPMELWLLNGPFGKDTDDRFGSGEKMHGIWPLDKQNPYYHWQEDIQYTYLAVLNMVASPAGKYNTSQRSVQNNPYVRKSMIELTVYAPNVSSTDGIEFILEFRKRGAKKFQRIDSAAKKDRSNIPGVNLDEIWKDVEWQPLKDMQGYKLIFDANKNFRTLIHYYRQSELRARMRVWPNGKNGKLFPGSNLTYSLPDPERKLDGDIKVADQQYYSVTRKISGLDIGYRHSNGTYLTQKRVDYLLDKYSNPTKK